MVNDHRWLKQLKPGDQVVVWYSRFGYQSYTKRVVDRITPSGIIVVDGHHYSPSTGQLRGDSGYGSSTSIEDPDDPYIVEQMKKYQQARYVGNVCNKFSKIVPTYEQAKQIAQVMDWSEEDLK